MWAVVLALPGVCFVAWMVGEAVRVLVSVCVAGVRRRLREGWFASCVVFGVVGLYCLVPWVVTVLSPGVGSWPTVVAVVGGLVWVVGRTVADVVGVRGRPGLRPCMAARAECGQR